MGELNIKAVEKMLEDSSSEKLLLAAIRGLKVDKKDVSVRMIQMGWCVILALLIGFSPLTVNILRECIELIISILLALFGIVFTGYALLQAFMNDSLLLQLFLDVKDKETENEKTRMQDVNENFISLMMLFILMILVSFSVGIFVKCIPADFLLFETTVFNNITASILISFILLPNTIVIWRTVAFVATMYKLFNAYAVTRVLTIIKKEREDVDI